MQHADTKKSALKQFNLTLAVSPFIVVVVVLCGRAPLLLAISVCTAPILLSTVREREHAARSLGVSSMSWRAAENYIGREIF